MSLNRTKVCRDLSTAVVVFGWALVGGACRNSSSAEHPAQTDRQMVEPSINAVLDEFDEELMALSGVVGVYVGVMSDMKTPCLKVMVVQKTPALEIKIPKVLKGFPVVIEETGRIRPLEK